MPVGSRNEPVLLFPWCTKKWNSSRAFRSVKGKRRVPEQESLWLGHGWSLAGGRKGKAIVAFPRVWCYVVLRAVLSLMRGFMSHPTSLKILFNATKHAHTRSHTLFLFCLMHLGFFFRTGRNTFSWDTFSLRYIYLGSNISAGREFGSLYECAHWDICAMGTMKQSNKYMAVKMCLTGSSAPLNITRWVTCSLCPLWKQQAKARRGSAAY